MDKLKDPAMILAVTANIGVVGTSAYFYKQIEAIRADLIKMSQTLTGVVRKIAEIEKGDQNKGEALHTLSDQIKRINQSIDELPSFDSIDELFENLDLDVNEIVSVMQNNGTEIERPSQSQRRIRNGDRRDRPRRPTEADSFVSRSTVRTTDRVRDRIRPSEIKTPSRRDTGRFAQTRSDPRMDPAGSSDDDERDLIDMIRRQQPRP